MSSTPARTVRVRLTLLLSILLLPVAAYMAFLGYSFSEESEILDRAVLTLGPIVLWLVMLAVVWFAIDLQVSRPVRRLTRATEAYSQGDLSVRPAPTGPAEVRELAVMFAELANKIEGREHELREAIETREAMMREIHHRVKNNLQIVTSLLNLQAKAVQGESAQRAFNDIQ